MTRRESRAKAIQLLFERCFDYDRTPEQVMLATVEDREEKISIFAKELFLRADENLGDIDEKIARCADNWRIDRIDRVTLSILRIAACEIDFFPEIPVEITVDEAIELARYFGEADSAAFINGVLGKYVAGIEKPFAKKKATPETEPDENDESELDAFADLESIQDLQQLDGDVE